MSESESTPPFLGLTMPVFTAFGWAGEETAVKFALEQMKEFVAAMQGTLTREAQMAFPHHGLDSETQGVYLAHALETDSDVYMTYHARPMALRMAVHLNDRNGLNRGFTTIQKHPDAWVKALNELGDAWEVRFQQMEYNPDTNEATHYKDLHRGPVSEMTAELSAELVDRMVYLNGEEKWLAPVTLTRSYSSEFIAAMNTGVSAELGAEINETLMPVLRLLLGTTGAKGARKTSTKTTKARKKSKTTSARAVSENQVEEFTYVSVIKPLHLRKGFVNLTPAHWAFFAINSRTVTHPITLSYDGNVDKDSAMWRLVPSDMVRLVLSDKASAWFSDNFSSGNEAQLTVRKVAPREIEVKLELVN